MICPKGFRFRRRELAMLAAFTMRMGLGWWRCAAREALRFACRYRLHLWPTRERRNMTIVSSISPLAPVYQGIRKVSACCAVLAFAGCSSGTAQRAAPMAAASVGAQGSATDYSVASREARADYAGLLPQEVRPSAIRLGNNRCYYYVAGATIDPLISNTGGQVCL